MVAFAAIGLLKVKICYVEQVALASGASSRCQGDIDIQSLVGNVLAYTGIGSGAAGLFGTA